MSVLNFIRYALARLAVALSVFAVAVTFNFALPRMVPGDPIAYQVQQMAATGGGAVGDPAAIAEAYRKRLGLDQPILVQYGIFWKQLLSLNFGTSLSQYPTPVVDIIAAGLPWTLGLLGTVTLLAFPLGALIGGLMAWPATSKPTMALAGPVIVLSAVPYFLVGMVLMFVFAITLKFLPAGGGFPATQQLGWNWPTVSGIVRHATLPALSMVLAQLGSWALTTRAMMISVRGEDYIWFGEAKGLRPLRLFAQYAMRNTLLPLLTKLAIMLGYIVSGAILVEVIFSYPGIGYKLYQAIQSTDLFLIQGIVTIVTLTVVLSMFLIEMLYPIIDPRIRTS